MFPAMQTSECITLDLLGLLNKTNRGFQYVLVIFDRYKKLNEGSPLQRIEEYVVAADFV